MPAQDEHSVSASRETSTGSKHAFHTSLAFRHRAAHENIFNGFWLYASLRDGVLDRMATERSTMRAVESTAKGLGQTSAGGGNNDSTT